MSDSLEPPAKKARLEADAPFYGEASLDAPGSPVDDMDDDFYDTTPVKPPAQSVVDGSASSGTAAASAPGFHLPGLGSVSEPVAAQPTSQNDASTAAAGEASEEGELSDADAFYHDEGAVEPAAANQAQQDAPAGEITAQSSEKVTEAAVAPEFEFDDSDGDDLARAITDGFAEEDGKADFLQAAEANKGNKDAEWQLDSDASDSDSSGSSSDDSSDDEGSDEGELLDPEEQVRRLMAEAVDEPGTGGKVKVKTINEEEEKFEKPDITLTDDSKITELGKVESVVENIVVIKGKVSGDFQVLESGSALCLQNRTVIGKISEQIGRVEEPRYSVGFNDTEDITTLGIAKDTPVYYVDEHSTFVFTEPLRAQKHTDASNLHDEETQDVEFSDDEKEAEYKREQKAKKRARQEDDAPEAQPPMKIPTGPRAHVDAQNYYQPTEYQGGGLKYSDDEDEDLGMYKPLARPDHFEQIVGQGAPLEDRSHVRRGMMRGRGGPWGDRGRGFRGRGGFGGRGDFGGGQGDRGGYGGGKGDRGGHANQGGNRGGAQGGRADRTCYACGQVGHQKRECPTLKPQLADRGRPQEQQNQQKNGQQQDYRSATSASPARQQDRGQSLPQHSPPAKSKNKNRKQRMREKKEKEREQQRQQQQSNQQQPQPQQQQQQHQPQASPAPPAAASTASYTNNNAAGWPPQYSNSPQPTGAYAPPPAPAAQYTNPAAYAQPAAQPPAQGQNQQANWAAWAQWLQVVGAMQQQQAQAAPAPPPPPQPQAPQPQMPVQYPYQYQQYAQNAAPPAPAPAPAQPQQQNQQSAQSLQDILRALGGGQR